MVVDSRVPMQFEEEIIEEEKRRGEEMKWRRKGRLGLFLLGLFPTQDCVGIDIKRVRKSETHVSLIKLLPTQPLHWDRHQMRQEKRKCIFHLLNSRHKQFRQHSYFFRCKPFALAKPCLCLWNCLHWEKYRWCSKIFLYCLELKLDPILMLLSSLSFFFFFTIFLMSNNTWK